MERTVGTESVDDLLAQFDGVVETDDTEIEEVEEVEEVETEIQDEDEGDGLHEEEGQGQEEVAPEPAKKLKLTPQSDLPVTDKKVRLNERVAVLKKKLDEAREASDKDAQAKLMDDIGNALNLIEAEDRLGAVEVAFGKAFGSDYKPSEVFRSNEWVEFGKQRKYGQDRAALYAQAVASNDSDAIAEIFADFAAFVGEEPKKSNKKPPVTPRSNVAAGAAAKPVVKRSLDSVISRYDDAVSKLLVGGIDRKEFDKIEAEYHKALAAA